MALTEKQADALQAADKIQSWGYGENGQIVVKRAQTETVADPDYKGQAAAERV